MVIKMKAIFKGLKMISQIFVHKEHEMKIGHPTDVRHVSHIGLGTADTCPSWMSEFRGVDDFTVGSMSSAAQSRRPSWVSLDFELPSQRATLPIEFYPDSSGQDPRGGPKRSRRRTKASRAPSLSPSSARSSSSRSRSSSFATACGDLNELLHGGLRVA